MKRRDYREVTVVGVGFGPGKKKMTRSDCWDLLVSEQRRGAGYRFVAGLDWVPGMAQVGLLAFSLFFLLLFLFLFSVFYFFHRFCINSSNNVKPISNLL
jgi:hypothetical protein